MKQLVPIPMPRRVATKKMMPRLIFDAGEDRADADAGRKEKAHSQVRSMKRIVSQCVLRKGSLMIIHQDNEQHRAFFSVNDILPSFLYSSSKHCFAASGQDEFAALIHFRKSI